MTEKTDQTTSDQAVEHIEEPAYGQPYSMENPFVWIKGYVQGQKNLTEVADDLQAVVDLLRRVSDQGWVLTDETDNGHINMHWGGEGNPPEEDRRI